MLSTIRNRMTGIIAGIIVGALIISFALWGVQSYFGIGGEPVVAKVNDTQIKLREFQRVLTELRNRLKQVLGEESFSKVEEDFIQEETVKRLVQTELVNQIVDNAGLYASNASVQGAITNLDIFKDDKGKFSQVRYESQIRQGGRTPRVFEEDLRKNLLSEQLQSGLAETVFSTSNETNQLLKLKKQMRDISYLRISIDDFIDTIENTNEEIENFYKQNENNYQEGEKVKISYIQLSVDEIAETIEVNEDDAKEYYLSNKDTYDVQEQRFVTKLSVKFEDQKSGEYNAKVIKDLEDALAKTKEGMSLEDIINEVSGDMTNKLQFTEHGFMLKGIMPKEIDEYLFSANEGDVSDIIKLETGAHIVAVGEIKGGPKNVFENVAEQVTHDYKRSKAQVVYADKYDQIATLSFEQPDSLEPAADVVGLELNETDYLYRDNQDDENKILANPKVIAQSFSPDLRELGVNSEPVEIAEEHIVVLRVEDYKAARIKFLEEVKEEVVSDLKVDKARSLAKEKSDELLAKLQVGERKDAIATENMQWQEHESITRDDITINRAVLRKAFSMPAPSSGESTMDTTSVSGGDYAVIVLSNVVEGSVEDSKKVDVKNVKLELLRRSANAEWQSFMSDVENNADISINTDNI